jgi:murein DD-endopeptidase MepM/ murein hydrolase activator NlpD/signal transduction histidine kinase
MPRWLYHLLAPAVLALAVLGPHVQARAAVIPPSGGLPRCGAPQPVHDQISLHDTLQAAYDAGVHDKEALATAGAVAMAESNLDVRAECVNDDDWSSRDRGLWQVNDHYHSEVSDADAFTARGNAAAMASITKDGVVWTEWVTYKTSAYKQNHRLDDARAAAAGIGGGSAGSTGGAETNHVVLDTPFHVPPDKAPVTQAFGCTTNPNEFPGNGCPVNFHTGTDYGLESGTPLFSPAAGVAIKAGPDTTTPCCSGGYGSMVIIDHGHGVRTLYGHLSAIEVAAGQQVARGQEFARSGGRSIDPGHGNSTGAHLHFSVSVNGAFINPVDALVGGVNGDGSGTPPSDGHGAPGGCTGVDLAGHCLTNPLTNPLDGLGAGITNGIQAAVGGFFANIGQGLEAWFGDLMRPFAAMNIWTDTPSVLTYGNTYVKMGWGYCLALADALILILIMGSGVKRMWDGFSGKRVPPASAQVVRFIAFGALANVSLFVLGTLIDTSNKIVQLIGLFDRKEILVDLLGLVGLTNLPALLGGGPFIWILAVALLIVKVVIFLALFMNMLYRIALIIFTLVTSPLGIMCFGFESLERYGRKWADAFFSALIQQFLQIVMLRVALGMSTDVTDITKAFIKEFNASSKEAPDLATAAARAAIASIATALMLGFVSLILMFFVLKIPKMINLQVAVAAGTSAAGGALAAMGWKVGGQAITAAAGAVGGPIAAAGVNMLGTAAFGRPMSFGGDMVAAGAGGVGGGAARVATSTGSTTVTDAATGEVTRERAWEEVRSRANGRETVDRTTKTTVPAGDSGREERAVEKESRDTPYEPRGGQPANVSWSDLKDAQAQWAEGRRAAGRDGKKTA